MAETDASAGRPAPVSLVVPRLSEDLQHEAERLLLLRLSRLGEQVAVGAHRCLCGFLDALGRLSLAGSASIVNFNPLSGGATPAADLEVYFEWALEGFRPRVEDCKDGILAILDGRSQARMFHYGRVTAASESRRHTESVLLCRTWLQTTPRASSDTETYVCLIGPCVSGAHYSKALASNLPGLVNEWFAWQVSQTQRRRVLLQRGSPDDEHYWRSLDECCVYPLGFHEILQALAEDGSASSAKRVEYVNRASGVWTKYLNEAHVEGCPHAARADDTSRANLQKGLSLWQTRFWEDRDARQNPEWSNWLSTSLSAIRDSASRLREDLDLRNPDERAFLRDFLARAIDDLVRLRNAFWNRPEARPPHLVCPARLAELTALVLNGASWTPRALEALMTVLAEYGHRVLDVPPRLDIAAHLKHALRGEPALYTLKPYYRDHFFHAAEVCLLGQTLLDSHVGPNRRLVQHLNENCEGQYSPRTEHSFRRQWWIAALTHDTGYGLEIVRGSVELLRFFDAHMPLRKFTADVQLAMRALGELVADYPELRDDPNVGSDHGVVQAEHLRMLLDRMGRSGDDFGGAVRAIALHNSRFAKIDARADPLAALLILCDSLQEWRRARLGFGTAPQTLVSRIVSSAPAPERRVFGPVDTFHFDMKRQHGSASPYYWADENRLEIKLVYGPEVNRNSGVFYLWLDTTYNLQRLDIRGWDLDVVIQFWTPRPVGPDAQLDRLEDLVSEVGLSFATPWLDLLLSRQTDVPIRYEERRREGMDWELITFDLKRLSERHREPILGGSIGAFYDRLCRWSRYFEDRDVREDGGVIPLF